MIGIMSYDISAEEGNGVKKEAGSSRWPLESVLDDWDPYCYAERPTRFSLIQADEHSIREYKMTHCPKIQK